MFLFFLRNLIVVSSIFLSTLSYAQKPVYVNTYYKRVVEAFSKNDTIQAAQLLDSLDNQPIPKILKNNADYYFMRALLHMQLFEAKNGGDTTDIHLLNDVYRSLKQIQTFDTNHQYTKPVKDLFSRLAGHYLYDGVETFNKRRYKQALYEFEKTLEINAYPFIMRVDTIVYFNAAIAAQKAGFYRKAIYYYSVLTSWNIGGIETYYSLAELYDTLGQTQKAIEVLKEAQKKYPGNRYMAKTLLSYYVKLKNYKQAINYLKSMPLNDSNLYSLGAIYGQLQQPDSAIYYYKKCLSLNAKFSDAAFNLGLSLYKKAYNRIKQTNKIDKTTKKILQQSAMYLEQSLTPQQHQNAHLETYKILRSIYHLLKKKRKENYYQQKIVIIEKN